MQDDTSQLLINDDVLIFKDKTPLLKHKYLKNVTVLLIFYSLTVMATFYYGQFIPNVILNYVENKYPLISITEQQIKASVIKSYLESGPYFIMFCFGPLIGIVSDKFGRKPILYAAILLSILDVLSCWVTIKTQNLIYFYIFHIIGGLNNVICGIVYSSIADLSNDYHVPSLFSFAGVCLGIGVLFGPLLFVYTSSFSNYPSIPIYLLLFLYISSLIIIPFILESRNLKLNNEDGNNEVEESSSSINTKSTNPFKILVCLFKNNGSYLTWLFILYFSLSFTSQDIDSTFYYYCSLMYGWGKTENGYFMMANGILIIIYSITIPLILNCFKKLSTKKLISIGFLFGVIAHLSYVLSNYGKYLYIIGAVVFGNFIPVKFNLIQSVISVSTPKKVKASLIVGIDAIGSISSFLGALTANYLYMVSISPSFYYPQLIYLLNLIIIFITFIASILIWNHFKNK